jgi:hypothetical protein
MTEDILEIVKSAYKEGYADATDVTKNSEHWWSSSISKSRVDYELKRIKESK